MQEKDGELLCDIWSFHFWWLLMETLIPLEKLKGKSLSHNGRRRMFYNNGHVQSRDRKEQHWPSRATRVGSKLPVTCGVGFIRRWGESRVESLPICLLSRRGFAGSHGPQLRAQGKQPQGQSWPIPWHRGEKSNDISKPDKNRWYLDWQNRHTARGEAGKASMSSRRWWNRGRWKQVMVAKSHLQICHNMTPILKLARIQPQNERKKQCGSPWPWADDEQSRGSCQLHTMHPRELRHHEQQGSEYRVRLPGMKAAETQTSHHTMSQHRKHVLPPLALPLLWHSQWWGRVGLSSRPN